MNECVDTITRHHVTTEGLSPILAALLASFLIWGVWRLYFKETSKLPAVARRRVRVLRSAALLTIVAAFVNPTWEIVLAQSRKPLVAIAVDSSRSMNLSDPQMHPAELVRRAVALGEIDKSLRTTTAMKCGRALRAGERALKKAEEGISAVHSRARHQATESGTADAVTAAFKQAEAARTGLLKEVESVAVQARQVEAALAGNPALLRRAEDARLGCQRLAKIVLAGFLPELYQKAEQYSATRVDCFEIEEAMLETSDTAKLCRKLADEYDSLQDESDLLLLTNADSNQQASIRAVGALSRRETLQRILSGPGGLLPQLLQNYRVRMYSLNDHLELLGLNEASQATWDAGGDGTDLGTGFQQLAAAVANENLAGVLVVSDGRHTEGPPPQETARELQSLGVPVHMAGIGSRRDPLDVALAGIQAPQMMCKDEMLEVRAFARQNGFSGLELKAKLMDGEDLIGAAAAALPKVQDAETVELRFRPVKLSPGRHSLSVQLAPVEGEAIRENNRLAFQTQVVERKIRVLLVEGMPCWEQANLCGALRSDLNVELNQVILATQPDRKTEITENLEIVSGKNRRLRRGLQPGEYPPSREDLFDYDAVFLGDFPILDLSFEEQKDLADFVRDKGGSLVLCASFRYNPYLYEDSALGELLPVTLPMQESDDEYLAFRPYFQDGYALELTPLGRSSPLCQLLPDMERNTALWRDLPKSHWRFHGLTARPQAAVLACTADTNHEPVIATHQLGLGRVLYVGLNDVWRWSTLDRSYSADFWRNALRWAMSGGNSVRSRHLYASTDRERYGMGDRISIGVQVADDDGRFVENDMLNAAIYRADNSKDALPPVPVRKLRLDAQPASPGIYSGSVEGLPEGRYVLRAVSAAYKSDKLNGLAFVIGRNPDLELRDVTLNSELLEELADQCGGEYFSEDRLRELPDFLPPGQIQESTRRSSRPLWDNYFYLMFVGCIFTAEWVLRKRSGLL